MFKFLKLHQQEDSAIIRYAANAAFVIPFAVMFFKVTGCFITSSLSLQASFVDSVSDMIASLVLIASIRISQRPANDIFQFGYGKVEALGSLIQSVFIFASGIFICREAYENFTYGEEVRYSGFAILVILFSTTLLFILTRIQKYVIQRTDSLIIKSSLLHFHLDILLDLGVVCALVLNHITGIKYIDSVFGLCFTIYIFRNSFSIMRKSFEVLLDQSLSQEEIAKIKEIVISRPEVKHLSSIQTRISGLQKFITLQILLEPSLHLHTVDEVKKNIIDQLKDSYKNCIIVIDIGGFNKQSILQCCDTEDGIKSQHEILLELFKAQCKCRH